MAIHRFLGRSRALPCLSAGQPKGEVDWCRLVDTAFLSPDLRAAR